MLPVPEFPGSATKAVFWDGLDRHIVAVCTDKHALTYVLHATHIKGRCCTVCKITTSNF